LNNSSITCDGNTRAITCYDNKRFDSPYHLYENVENNTRSSSVNANNLLLNDIEYRRKNIDKKSRDISYRIDANENNNKQNYRSIPSRLMIREEDNIIKNEDEEEVKINKNMDTFKILEMD
jgi:hypothetical protein